MLLLDTAIRGGAIALFLLLAAQAAPTVRASPAARYNLLFALCGIAYLIEAAPGLSGRTEPWLLPVRVLSLSTPAVFWLWAAVHFDDEFEPAWWRPWNGDVVKAALPAVPEDHLVEGADHFAFLAPCSTALAERAPQICRDNPGFDRTAFHNAFNAAVVTFFKAKLPTQP